jgi:acyl carrier protein
MLEKLKKIIAEQLNTDESAIKLSSSLKEDLGADSLDIFELVMALEEEYDTEFDQEDLAGLDTVEDILKYLASKGIEE